MVSQSSFTGKIYPDRSFSIGFVLKEKKGVSERRYDRDVVNQPETDYSSVADWLIGTNTITGEFRSLSEAPLLVKGAKSSQKARGKYGKHGITQYGKRFCRNTCILLQRKWGKERLGFGTATLPALSEENCKFILSRWAQITRRFYQTLKRICEEGGNQFLYVGVTEIQERRFRETNIAVPHLHFVYVAKRSVHGRYYFHTKQAYRAWNKTVNQVLRKENRPPIMGVNGHQGSVKLEPIRKSAASYIGKYISKGCAVVRAMQEEGYDEFPAQWWTASMHCKKMFKDSIIRMDAYLANSFFYELEHYLHEGSIVWARFVDVCVDGCMRTFGLVGKLSKDAYMRISSA